MMLPTIVRYATKDGQEWVQLAVVEGECHVSLTYTLEEARELEARLRRKTSDVLQEYSTAIQEGGSQ